MSNLLSFLSYFQAYLVTVICCAAIMGVAIFIGIKLRKSKNNKELTIDAQGSETEN